MNRQKISRIKNRITVLLSKYANEDYCQYIQEKQSFIDEYILSSAATPHLC